MDLDPGTVVANRYRISRQLGRGGMGEVFAAENIRTGRPVAVKLLRSDSKSKSSAVARFRREARAAGSINSDHVTQVLDVEEDAEHGIVLVFELLEGESLIDRLKRTGPIPFDELHGIIEQVWIGLADAHKAGIIHRDLKPSNVFLERRPDGQTRVKILDFGISKLPKEMGGETLTEMGQSLGTFSFMPPEQIGKAKTVDHRADIYACGTLIYQALSGQLPYAARNILVMVEMKSKADARRLADAMGGTVDPRLEDFLTHTLARDPGQRFQSATEALTVWRELRPENARPVQPSSNSLQPPSSSTPGSGVDAVSGPSVVRQDAMPLTTMETTTDSAATIAMPLSHFTSQAVEAPRAAAGGTHEVASGHSAMAATPSEQKRPPLANLAQTMPLTREGGPDRNTGSGAAPYAGGGVATPTRGTPAFASSPPNAGRVYEEPSSTAPQSQDKTKIYQPAPMPSHPSRPDLASHTLPVPLQRRRSAIPFVIGAIAFALVGFGIVAALLQYFRTGNLMGH